MPDHRLGRLRRSRAHLPPYPQRVAERWLGIKYMAASAFFVASREGTVMETASKRAKGAEISKGVAQCVIYAKPCLSTKLSLLGPSACRHTPNVGSQWKPMTNFSIQVLWTRDSYNVVCLYVSTSGLLAQVLESVKLNNKVHMSNAIELDRDRVNILGQIRARSRYSRREFQTSNLEKYRRHTSTLIRSVDLVISLDLKEWATTFDQPSSVLKLLPRDTWSKMDTKVLSIQTTPLTTKPNQIKRNDHSFIALLINRSCLPLSIDRWWNKINQDQRAYHSAARIKLSLKTAKTKRPENQDERRGQFWNRDKSINRNHFARETRNAPEIPAPPPVV